MFLTLPKLTNPRPCKEFSTISFVGHVLKVFLRIFSPREENIIKTQFGFRNSLGTPEALFSVQVFFQRYLNVIRAMKLKYLSCVTRNNQQYCLFQDIQRRRRFRIQIFTSGEDLTIPLRCWHVRVITNVRNKYSIRRRKRSERAKSDTRRRCNFRQ